VNLEFEVLTIQWTELLARMSDISSFLSYTNKETCSSFSYPVAHRRILPWTSPPPHASAGHRRARPQGAAVAEGRVPRLPKLASRRVPLGRSRMATARPSCACGAPVADSRREPAVRAWLGVA
jgi:hypothetical protein